MTKKYVLIAEHLLLHGIGYEPIFITQMSQIMKRNKNTTFSDINGTSQKSICVVVDVTERIHPIITWCESDVPRLVTKLRELVIEPLPLLTIEGVS